jgi:hypothetical protein
MLIFKLRGDIFLSPLKMFIFFFSYVWSLLVQDIFFGAELHDFRRKNYVSWMAASHPRHKWFSLDADLWTIENGNLNFQLSNMFAASYHLLCELQSECKFVRSYNDTLGGNVFLTPFSLLPWSPCFYWWVFRFKLGSVSQKWSSKITTELWVHIEV